MPKGSVLGPEMRRVEDPRTHAEYWLLTDSPSNSNHLYPEVRSFLHGDREMIFVSDRSGEVNLYKLDLDTGRMVQLTDRRGIRGCSVDIDYENRVVFYGGVDGDRGWIRTVNVDTLEEELIHVTPPLREVGVEPMSGLRISPHAPEVATILHLKGDVSALYVVDVKSGEGEVIVSYPAQEYRLGHVQYHPTDKDVITYLKFNMKRIEPGLWTRKLDRNTGREKRVYLLKDIREKTTHDFWERSGRYLTSVHYYRQVYFPVSIKRFPYRGGEVRNIVTSNSIHFCHCRSTDDEQFIVADEIRAFENGLYLIDSLTGNLRVMCYPDSSWDSRGREYGWGAMVAHPHPSFSWDNRHVAFVTDFGRREKGGQICMIDTQPFKDALCKLREERPSESQG